MNILFICNQNQNRSKTAADLFKDRFQTSSAGLFSPTPLTEDQLSWAETVVVMEESQRSELARRFPKQYLQKRIISLDIPDIYRFNQPELIAALKQKVPDSLEPFIE
jgi:predicted protein tyrosine phosphatase